MQIGKIGPMYHLLDQVHHTLCFSACNSFSIMLCWCSLAHSNVLIFHVAIEVRLGLICSHMLQSSGRLSSRNILKVTSSGFIGLTKGLLYFKFVQVPHCPSCHALVLLLSWVVEEDQIHISWDCLLVVNILWCSDRPYQQCHCYSLLQSSCSKLVN